ncbi:MAG: CHAT domain-containing protein [Terriglobales bacterium]
MSVDKSLNALPQLWPGLSGSHLAQNAACKDFEAFYRNLNHGTTKSEAMRQAKLSPLRGSRQLWQHPYFWAAFIVEGQGL